MIGLYFFPLKSADVSGAGMHDEPPRASAYEARLTGKALYYKEAGKRQVLM